jgi:hypothetical protein
MAYSELENLLRSARALMDRYMFDGEELRDDVANLCMKIDDALPDSSVSTRHSTNEEMINAAA